jgi:cytochrome c oxidase assembly protein subunit 20
LDPNQKTLNVWSKPIDEQDAANPHRHPTIADAVSTIKMDDFANVANTPCARNGLLTGIASGFGVGGLRFILSGSFSSQLWTRLEFFRLVPE